MIEAMFVVLGLLPGIALAGPLLIGRYFDADWITRVGVAFDVLAILLGAGSFYVAYGEVGLRGVGSRLLAVVGAGLVVFGLLFGGISVWLLRDEEDGR